MYNNPHVFHSKIICVIVHQVRGIFLNPDDWVSTFLGICILEDTTDKVPVNDHWIRTYLICL